MQLTYTNSKVVPPLIIAFLSMGILVLVLLFINYYLTKDVYGVLESHASSSEKMHLITSLVETAHFRTRLTGQMLVTKDYFERDEITQKLNTYASRFARLRRQLLSLPLSEEESTILKGQGLLIAEILPKQRQAAELAMSDEIADIERAQHILYLEVIPNQTLLIESFMVVLKKLRDDVISSTEAANKTNRNTVIVQIALIIIFSIFALLVAAITIRRILRIERDFHKANIELTRLNTVKTDFISLVSHELRTPLTSIKSFSEILMDDIEELDLQTQKRYLSIIDSESDRLNRLVSNILDVQKIDSNKMAWNDEELVLNDITQQSIAAFSGAYQAKNIDLVIAAVPEDLTVIADSDKLKQVMSNLLSNALKFTEQGEVLVTVIRYKTKGTNNNHIDMARVSVSDSGIGIQQDQLTKVFDSFYQVDNSATRKKGGSGLGLDICRKIINHYEGDIWVESKPNQGSTFYFEIPLVHAQKKKIGETLIELGMITNDQLQIALKQQ